MPRYAYPPPERPCLVPGCDRIQVTRGMCRRHYLQTWRAEHPERVAGYRKADRVRPR